MLIVIGLIFLPAAVMKFNPPEEMLVNFTKWDLIGWMKYIGTVELIGVTLIFLPKTRLYGTLILTGIMGGAIQTHYSNDEPFFFHITVISVLWINYLIINKKIK